MNRTLGIVMGLLAIGTLSWAAPGELVVYPTLADYEAATGNSISSFGEAPILAQRVAAGELREVADRLPDEPLVVDPLEALASTVAPFRPEPSDRRSVASRQRVCAGRPSLLSRRIFRLFSPT